MRAQFASFKVDALTKQPQPFTDGAPLHGKEVPSVVFEGKKLYCPTALNSVATKT